jgi:hypothetical protein
MLEQIACIFENMKKMTKRLKKASYERNMEAFLAQHGHYFREMADYMEQEEDKAQAAETLSAVFCDAVEQQYGKNGKIRSTTQIDLNFFMIFYVFPAILKTESAEAKLLADTLCDLWGKRFKDSKIGYADYDKLHDSFREKIFGLF